MDVPYRFEPLSGLSDRLAELGLSRAVVITDSNVARLYPQELPTVVFPAGEASKTLATAAWLYDRLAELGVDRKTGVVALGGGVVGDLAGFVAATMLRGLPLVQVPTTLLAMVDSSIGGKVGVDLACGKNLVGAFYPPRAILCDPQLLGSLPGRELAGGMAEVIKHALLDSPDHFASLRQPGDMRALVERSAAVKIGVVGRDPYEQGERAHLNLGHTLGHALETASGYQLLSHGEAVAIGMVFAVRLSRRLGRLEHDFEAELRDQLERSGLPAEIPPTIPWEAVEPALSKDKKNLDGKLAFVLPFRIGRVELVRGVDVALVRELYAA